MNTVSNRGSDLRFRLGLDGPTPLAIRREAARELCAEIIRNLDNTSRAFEFSERAAFILFGEGGLMTPIHPRLTAHRLFEFLSA
jgi:hypothetical protein